MQNLTTPEEYAATVMEPLDYLFHKMEVLIGSLLNIFELPSMDVPVVFTHMMMCVISMHTLHLPYPSVSSWLL